MSIEEVKFNGMSIWPGATSVNPFSPGAWYFYITLQYPTYQGYGQVARHGLVLPPPNSQYGQMVADVIEWVYRQSGATGGGVPISIHFAPHVIVNPVAPDHLADEG